MCKGIIFLSVCRSEKKLSRRFFLAEDQQVIREEILKRNLSAFVANGSILPRESGISSRPMKNGVPFRSPKEMEVEMELPRQRKINGMGDSMWNYFDRRRRLSREIHIVKCAGSWCV